MPKKKVEVYDKDKLIYPFIENDHVTFSNGMKVSEMLDQGISMPKVTHEDSSFKVGVGDQDVSSAIVDSSVAEMVIKGQTYQNILPEPSLRNKMIGKSMQRLNEGYDNIEVVDGVSKSAILTGQTLVNLVTEYNTNSSQYASVVFVSPNQLKTNTKYLMMIKNKSSNEKKFYMNENLFQNWISFPILPNEVKTFTNITKSSIDTSSNRMPILKNNATSTTDVILEVLFIEYQEGMENWDIPYFEGMQSVKLPALKTVGKNLLEEDIPLNYVGHGTVNNMTRIEKGKTYTYRNNKSLTFDSRIVFRVFDEKGKLLDSSTTPITIVRDLYYNSGVKCYAPNANITNANSCFTSNVDGYIRFGLFAYPEKENRDLCFELQLEEGRVPTSYEPYKSNILRTPEEVVLKGLPNGVADTLNVNTGEYVQRTGKIILNGSEEWAMDNEASDSKENTSIFYSQKFTQFKKLEVNERNSGIVCNGYPVKGDVYGSDVEGMMFNHVNVFYFRVKKSVANNVGDFKQWLSQNPKEVQLELVTPTIKTVDLSTSGNWEKVVLDGSENWARHGNYGSVTRFNVTISNMAIGHYHVFSDKFPRGTIGTNDLECVNNHYSVNQFQLQIKTSRLTSDSVDGLKQYLSQNPITVWYQTATTLDSTKVKQSIFFADGHIIQSSGADNSLIPTLDYQAKTRNSYVMDLMKPNTRYTMKAKSASGTFTIDGTSYGAGTNGTFTTPTSMTNKLLVMSNKTNEEVMIIEGDLTSKTIPYFKGIKSAFESEDEIEIVSTGKNLYPYGDIDFTSSYVGWHDAVGTSGMYGDIKSKSKSRFLLPKGTYIFRFKSEVNVLIATLVDDVEKTIGVFDEAFTLVEDTWLTLRVKTAEANMRTFVEEIVISATKTNYEPHKSNTTKIPLLSSLRSLPNGVCDEVILDREKNKAQIIQRVGEIVFDGSEDEGWAIASTAMSPFAWALVRPKPKNNIAVCDKMAFATIGTNDYIGVCIINPDTDGLIRVRTPEIKIGTTLNNWQEYLRFNPMKVQYELGTPIITEVDLEGFPYIYKDGHIFLNSEIAPTTQITYSINQAQQIESANENLQRHEKEISHLQKLIAQYIQVEYESTLLSLKI